MNTPIYDFLRQYAGLDILRAHMPGHKGGSPAAGLAEAFRLDITEISGADSLFEADGIIADSERNTASLYGSAGSAFSAGGSTLCKAHSVWKALAGGSIAWFIVTSQAY